MKTLFQVKFGSHLYGTNTPESDTDFKGVYVPDKYDIILQRVKPVIVRSTGDPKEKNSSEDIDDELFSLQKYFSMLMSGDMIAYEMLFVKKEQALVWSDEWDVIHRMRARLINRDIKGFVGYIRSQVNKYGVKGSRIATARRATSMFETLCAMKGHNAKLREVDFSVFEDFVEMMDHCSIVYLPSSKNDETLHPYFEVLNRKISMNISLKEAYNITNRILIEYGHRAQEAENNQNVDWKSVYHAVRVSEQALELLSTGQLTFPRHNVPDLMRIRRGERPFMDVAHQLEDNLDRLERMMETSVLPAESDDQYMNKIVYECYLEQVQNDR